MARWTMQQVEQAAPDDKSIKAAKKLARPAPWSDTGSTDALVWGKCQGSGSKPYQVTVDLTGPAFKCSCPSRKFPCKHGLALLMLWAGSDGEISNAVEPADFAEEWANDRAGRATKAAARKANASPPDPAAQAKRLEQRIELMTAGIVDFELWLADLVRQGMAAARSQPYTFWDNAAGRLVDSQLPGLADQLRTISSEIHRRDDWADHLLHHIGLWFTAVRSWQRRDELGAVDLANLRSLFGWSYSTDEIRSGQTVDDTWMVLGVRQTDDGRLQAQRTWLLGIETGITALILDFAAAGGALRVANVVGSEVKTPVAFYPGSGQRRSIFAVDPVVVGSRTVLPDGGTIKDAISAQADLLAENPWLRESPAVLTAALLVTSETGGSIVDANNDALPLAEDVPVDQLLALTGGEAVPMFAEVRSGHIRPITIALDGELVLL